MLLYSYISRKKNSYRVREEAPSIFDEVVRLVGGAIFADLARYVIVRDQFHGFLRVLQHLHHLLLLRSADCRTTIIICKRTLHTLLSLQ